MKRTTKAKTIQAPAPTDAYLSFLQRKAAIAPAAGFEPTLQLNAHLFPFQRDVVTWALRRGRAALFEDCGMGKSLQQLEWARHVVDRTGKPVLILTPLAVAAQTEREAARFGIDAMVVSDASDVVRPTICITNYEKLHKFQPDAFGGVVLDESSILKSYDGKTRTAIVESFRRTPYRLACTATPAPNDHEELGNHAEFLGVMSRTEMLASFFCHDGGETQVWRLKGHAERIFWQWVASWAVSLRSPEDLGYPADGYALPAMAIHRHLLPLDGFSADRGLLFETGDGFGLSERRGARRASLDARVAQVAALVAAEPDEPWLIWCGLNAEGDALTRAIPGAVQVAGSDDADTKAKRMLGFSDGSVRVLVTKAGIAGFGMNWQHCARMVFAGMDDSYESFYQAVRRCFRFGQQREVRVHIVASEPESVVIDNVLRKERDHKAMLSAMAEHARSVQVANVRGIARETDPYNPTRKMIVPAWLCSDSEVA